MIPLAGPDEDARVDTLAHEDPAVDKEAAVDAVTHGPAVEEDAAVDAVAHGIAVDEDAAVDALVRGDSAVTVGSVAVRTTNPVGTAGAEVATGMSTVARSGRLTIPVADRWIIVAWNEHTVSSGAGWLRSFTGNGEDNVLSVAVAAEADGAA